MPAAASIHFHYLVAPFHFPKRTALKSFLRRMISSEGGTVDTINFIFCDDDYLLHLNLDYLQHNTLTDIISFQISPAGEPLLADIFISTERVRENARSYQASFLHELHRVIFHGALHLVGYKDKTPKDARVMRNKEAEYLEKWFHGTQFR